jgi:hypothetical protein
MVGFDLSQPKKVAPTTKKTGTSKGGAKKNVQKSGLFESTPRKFTVGNAVQPKRDLTRFVRWPRYILVQRQKRILMKRLKVPPALNQFTKACDSNQGTLELMQPRTSSDSSASTLLRSLRTRRPD